MCGIVGYVGLESCQDFLVQGLRRLEYRGYDSSGVATITPEGRFGVSKAAGRIDRLCERLARSPARGTIGIGHTRLGDPRRRNGRKCPSAYRRQ